MNIRLIVTFVLLVVFTTASKHVESVVSVGKLFEELKIIEVGNARFLDSPVEAKYSMVFGTKRSQQKINQKYVVNVPLNEAGIVVPETRIRELTIEQHEAFNYAASKVRFTTIAGQVVSKADAKKSINKNRAFWLNLSGARISGKGPIGYHSDLIVVTPVK